MLINTTPSWDGYRWKHMAYGTGRDKKNKEKSDIKSKYIFGPYKYKKI